MALASTRFEVISRSGGKAGKSFSATAAAAYRSAEKIKDERTGEIHDYTKKQGVVYDEILLPDNAPERFKSRSTLWNEVEQIEKRKDSQLARSVYFALPRELTREQNIELSREIAREFIKQGMIADLTIHAEDGNPHAHILLTMREIEQDRFGEKNRAWNAKENATLWRKEIEKQTNQALERYGHEQRIDMRSYAEQGKDQIPTMHLGHSTHQLEQKGIETDRGNINREIQRDNQRLQELRAEQIQLERELEQIKQEQERSQTAGQGKEEGKKSLWETWQEWFEQWRQSETPVEARKPPEPERPPERSAFRQRYDEATERHQVKRDPDRLPRHYQKPSEPPRTPELTRQPEPSREPTPSPQRFADRYKRQPEPTPPTFDEIIKRNAERYRQQQEAKIEALRRELQELKAQLERTPMQWMQEQLKEAELRRLEREHHERQQHPERVQDRGRER